MIVAAAIGAGDARQKRERFPIETERAERWPHRGSDEYDIAAAFSARKAKKAASLHQRDPVMRIALDCRRIGPAAYPKHHDAPAVPHGGIGDSKRYGAAA